ncbi:hypothetical protein M2139_000493 [Enterococcus sp. PF1-24]|uniref:hypothetical protein n=1 Tax=unclassified Enterococcus TaxID=2608891 RepID=UPI0024768288|nr:MULTISPECIES: hypothetical protein [unclassified Enterococcus]MDH6363518.1 hypothetical protein [Enterococcus sp. PFB1-1]MDH6400612.1 hypothetical protein [Enterococcus sp. PF1-24]
MKKLIYFSCLSLLGASIVGPTSTAYATEVQQQQIEQVQQIQEKPTEEEVTVETTSVESNLGGLTIVDLGEDAISYSEALENKNPILTKYEANSEEIEVEEQGNLTILFDSTTFDAVIILDDEVLAVPAGESVELTAVDGTTHTIKNDRQETPELEEAPEISGIMPVSTDVETTSEEILPEDPATDEISLKTIQIVDLGSNAIDYSFALAQGNPILQKYEEKSADINVKKQGNATVLFDRSSNNAVLVLDEKVVNIPKFASADVTDDQGKLWTIRNASAGKFKLQDAEGAAAHQAAQEAWEDAAVSAAGNTGLAVADAFNLLFDIIEGAIFLPSNAILFVIMIVLGFLSAIPFVGLITLIIDGFLIIASSIWHVAQYIFSTLRRTAVVHAGTWASNEITAGLAANAVNEQANADETGSLTDEAVADVAVDQAIINAVGNPTPAIVTNNVVGAGSAGVQALAEVGFVGVEWILGLAAFALHGLGAALFASVIGIPISWIPWLLSFIPLAIDGVVMTAHAGFNLSATVMDEIRRIAILGGGGAVGLIASSVAIGNAINAQNIADSYPDEVYTWDLENIRE